MLRYFKRFGKDEEGAATIEFVIVFPALIALLFSNIEAGWLMTRSMMLERGVSIAARDLKLGYDHALTYEGLRAQICEHASILANCRQDLALQVVKMDIASSYPQDVPECVDRTGPINPKLGPVPGGREEVMFVRACMVIDPIMPGIGLGLQLPKDATGGVQLVTYTAFMNEPA